MHIIYKLLVIIISFYIFSENQAFAISDDDYYNRKYDEFYHAENYMSENISILSDNIPYAMLVNENSGKSLRVIGGAGFISALRDIRFSNVEKKNNLSYYYIATSYRKEHKLFQSDDYLFSWGASVKFSNINSNLSYAVSTDANISVNALYADMSFKYVDYDNKYYDNMKRINHVYDGFYRNIPTNKYFNSFQLELGYKFKNGITVFTDISNDSGEYVLWHSIGLKAANRVNDNLYYSMSIGFLPNVHSGTVYLNSGLNIIV